MRRKILKKKYKNLCKLVLGGIAFFSSMFINQHNLKALPVVDNAGNNSVTFSGKEVNISGTGNAVIKWQDFSLRPGETANFNGMTNMLNYVTKMNPSLIYGDIQAQNVNNFYIINPSGILFGPSSHVYTKNFYVSTRSLTDEQISAFTGTGLLIGDATNLINNGGLKSSDIFGTYDIADGDVMFLGEVQADKLIVEGNTIQIRNTAKMKNTSGGQLTDVTLYSNNQPEVGYVVSENTGDQLELQNTLGYDYSLIDQTASDAEKVKLANKHGIFVVMTNNETKILTNFASTTNSQLTANSEASTANSEIIDKLFELYQTATAGKSDNEKILVMLALDKLVEENSAEDTTKTVYLYAALTGETEKPVDPDNIDVVPADQFNAYHPTMINLTEDDLKVNSAKFTAALQTVTDAFNETKTNADYKYWRADSIGDKNMPNSANKLGWKAYTLSGNDTLQTIADYRLIETADDLQKVNYSKWTAETQLAPAEGKVHGNYMLDNNINLTGVNFAPLGYGMEIDDFASKDDLINFNGLDFTIKGLSTDTSKDTLRQGLFSIFNGTIENLRLSDVGTIETTKAENGNYPTSTYGGAGALIGVIGYKGGVQLDHGWGNTEDTEKAKQLNTTIKNVSVLGNSSDGKVTSKSNVGGLVGFIGYGKKTVVGEDNGSGYTIYAVPGTTHVTFENVENFGKVVSNSSDIGYTGDGGLVGYVNGYGSVDIINSTNAGDLTTKSGSAGGLVGKISNTSLLKNVSNTGNITATNDVGGIAGTISNTTIKHAWNEGYIKTTSGITTVGGIISEGNGNSYLDEVFNLGTVDNNRSNYTGGIAGELYGGTIKNSYNAGTVIGGSTSSNKGNAGGIVGHFNGSGTIENVYNSGSVTAYYAGGLIGKDYYTNGTKTLKNSYNVGTVTGNNTGGITGYLTFSTPNYENVYNFAKVTKSTKPNKTQFDKVADYFGEYGIFGTMDLDVSYPAWNDYKAVYNYPTLTNVKGGAANTGDLKLSDILDAWSVDSNGTDSNKTWRLYANPANDADKTRQPLLTSFLQDATIQRYNEAEANATVEPAELATLTNNGMHVLHDSDGKIIDVRYRNTGKSTIIRDSNGDPIYYEKGVLNNPSVSTESDGVMWYNVVNPHAVLYNIATKTGDTYTVSETNNEDFTSPISGLARALMKSTQFGYNFKFDDTTNKENYSSDTDSEVQAVASTPEANMIYLKNGTAPTLPEIKKPVEDVQPDPGVEDVYYDFTITVQDGDGEYVVDEYYGESGWKYTFDNDEDSEKPSYTVSGGGDGKNLNDFTIESEVTTGTDMRPSGTAVKITYDGKTYSVDNGGLVENGDGTYTLKVKVTDHVYYNIKVYPGDITIYESVKVQVTGGTRIDGGEITYNDTSLYNVTGNSSSVISGLLDGKVEVVQTSDSDGYDRLTLKIKNDSSTMSVGESKTVDGVTFTKLSDTSYSYTATDGTRYKITLNNGWIQDYVTRTVTITAGGGSLDGDGNLVLNNADNPYTITVTDKAGNETSDTNVNDYINNTLSGRLIVVKSDDDMATVIALDPEKAKLVQSSDGNYYVFQVKGNYSFYDECENITKNSDGSYTYRDTPYWLQTSSGANVIFTVKVVNGLIAEPGSTTIPITIKVGSGTLTDNVFALDDANALYTVTNSDNNTEAVNLISGLLSGKVTYEVNNGNVILKLADGTTLTEGDNTYTSIQSGKHTYTIGTNTYTITKNSGSSYTYTITNTADSTTTNYVITLTPGQVKTVTNYDVTVTVAPRTTDTGGNLTNITGTGYSVTDDTTGGHSAGGADVISALLNNQVTVVKSGDDKVTLQLSDGTTLGSTYTDTANNKTYTITKTANADGTTTYKVTTTDTTSTKIYNVTLNPGALTTPAEPTTVYVKINVGDGQYTDNVFSGGDYTTDVTVGNDFNISKTKTTVDGKEITVVTIAYGGTTYTVEGITPDGDGNYVITIPTSDNGDKYVFTIDPGAITSVTNVTVNVGNGSLNDGVFSDTGYTVGDTTIQELLKNVTVTYSGDRTILTNLPAGLIPISGNKYEYTAGDGTKYIVTINPGDLSIYNTPQQPTPTPSTPTPEPTSTPEPTPTPSTPAETTPATPSTPAVVDNTPTEPTTPTVVEPVTPEPTITNLSVLVSVGNGTLTDGVFANTGYTIGNPTIKDLFSGATVTYDGDRTILTNLPAGLTSIGNNQYTYTVTDPDGNQTIYTITVDPGLLSIFNTPVQTTEPEIETVTPEPAVEVTPEVQTVNATIDDPDVELRSSNLEEFGGEKGDYVDLDLQDHTLIEVTDTNVAVDELNATPEEFSAEASRNIVNNEGMELTSITDTPTADISTDITDSVNIPTDFNAADGANIGDFQAGGELDGGLSSLDSTSSNSNIGGNNGRGSRNENSFSGGNSANNRNSNGLSNTSNSSNNSNSRGNSASNRNSSGNRSANSTSSSNSNNDSDSGSSDSSSSSNESQNNGELGAVEVGQSDSQQETSTSENESSQEKNSDSEKSKSESDSEQNADNEDNEDDEESSSEK